MRAAIAVLLSVAAFLGAAKVHGRQLRLERETAGYPTVVFGGQNPPYVEALWRAERWRFWAVSLGLAALAGLLGVTVTQARGVWTALAVLLWAPTASFFVNAGWSAWRRANDVQPTGAHEPWIQKAK